MSTLSHRNFEQRASSLLQRPRPLGRKVRVTVSDDGLIVRRRRRASGLSLRGLLRIAVVFWVFKVIAVLNIGLGDYTARIDALTTGNALQRAAATVLHADPVTRSVTRQVISTTDMLRRAERVAIF